MTRDRIHCPPSEKQATLDHFFPIRGRIKVIPRAMKVIELQATTGAGPKSTNFAWCPRVRFTVEQIHLIDARGQCVTPTEPQYFMVEADSVDAALQDFLALSAATLIGNVLKYPSSHAIATARAGDTVFTVEIMPGTDAHRRAMPRRDA